MVTANGFAERATELEEAARGEEAHEVALSATQGQLVLDLVAAVFDDVALPRPDALLRARLQGWPQEPDADFVEAAREDVRRVIRADVRAEFAAEAARLARLALPAAEDEDQEPLEDEPEEAEVVEEQPEGERQPYRVPEYRPAPLTKISRYSHLRGPGSW